MKTVHLIVEGKVQGVFYRASAKTTALGLGLNGWVRNCADGRVEILASGEEANIEDFIAWSRKGPDAAEVTHVTVTEVSTIPLQKFDIRK